MLSCRAKVVTDTEVTDPARTDFSYKVNSVVLFTA